MTIQVNEIYPTNKNGPLKVIEYINCNNVKVQFLDTGYIRKAQASKILNGRVKDKLKPIVRGVGFIGDGEYDVLTHKKEYKCWENMLERCYCPKYQEKRPTYKGCTTCEDWHDFQNFSRWYEENYPKDDKEYQLDKDFLVKGNKVYSPDTCCFISCQKNIETSHSKNYKFISPEGDVIKIFNLNKFCREHGLAQSAMCNVYNGKCKQHKGWRKA